MRGFQDAASRIIAAARMRPSTRDWTEAAALLLAVAGFAWFAGFQGGLFTLAPVTDARAIARVVLIAQIVPALFEEAVFRAGLHPPAGAACYRLRVISALAAFVVWHPLQRALGAPWATEAFVDPRFLAIATALGAACATSYARARSLWPPVAIHAVAVIGWKLATGG